jgi:PAS domain S-box-containing protein/putative nucleotidyltransferase with HDIG domain
MTTKTRILVVEDENIVARDIGNMLLGLGYDVVGVVPSGEEAVELAREARPNLALVDVMLQGEMTGVDAADEIYSDFNIPVVYLTAYADETTLQRAKETEPFGYLLKPFEERELQTTVEIALYKFKMEMKLRNRERWLTTILQSVGDGVVATDENGRIQFMNPCAEDLTGWTQDEATGKNLKDVFHILNEKSGKPLAIPSDKILKGERFRIASEVILSSKNAAKTHVHQNAAPIREESGEISGIVLAFSDITRSKMAEEELKKSWEQQKSAMEGTVQAMAYTIETRDPYTAGHQRRVTKLACAIAAEMKLTENEMEGVRLAGGLHDLGKIYVPAEILAKPGKLTAVEYNIIKTHPQVGYDILKSIEFPWPIADFVLQHHERLDGSGYPNGLTAEEISIEARILAVADVIEAMATHRPYRAALTIETALGEIEKNRGSKYDGRVVDACLSVFKNKKFDFDKF